MDETPKIQSLQIRESQLEKEIAELAARAVPRPTPSQYLRLREDVVRFGNAFGSQARLLGLVKQLEVSRLEILGTGLFFHKQLCNVQAKTQALMCNLPLQVASHHGPNSCEALL